MARTVRDVLEEAKEIRRLQKKIEKVMDIAHDDESLQKVLKDDFGLYYGDLKAINNQLTLDAAKLENSVYNMEVDF